MCNRWNSGRDLPAMRAADRNIPLMTCVCSMAKATSKLLSCFLLPGLVPCGTPRAARAFVWSVHPWLVDVWLVGAGMLLQGCHGLICPQYIASGLPFLSISPHVVFAEVLVLERTGPNTRQGPILAHYLTMVRVDHRVCIRQGSL